MANGKVASDPLASVQAEIADQTHELLSMLLPFIPVIGYLWLYYTTAQRWPIGINGLVTLLLWAGAALVHLLSRRSQRLACWLLVLVLMCAEGLVVAAHPSILAMALGLPIVILANMLLGSLRGGAVAVCLWFVAAGAWHVGTGLRPWQPDVLAILLLHALLWGASFVGDLPHQRWVASALAGWRQAREALAETRERRAELYKVVRALEEATYRIQRTNNELLVARAEADRLRAAKARFLATVSHELRGPLNLILGFSRLIALSPEKYGQPLPGAYVPDIDAIYRNSEHLVNLVDDILDLSQIEAERLPLVKELTDLEEEVIGQAVQAARPLAERKGLYLRWDSQRGPTRVLADPLRLRQVLLNLLTNAVRFTDQGGITIRTERRDEQVEIIVRDTGRGIAPEQMPLLFREFSQVHRTETRAEAGSGLGLCISKELIALHGGTIWAENEPGSGTAFHFTLPLVEEAASTGLVKTAQVQPRGDSLPVLLVVHDDPATTRLLARYVEGCRVLGATSAEQAFALVEQSHPRAILAAPQAASLLERRLSTTPYDVPIISWTAAQPAGRHMEGVLGYVPKPVTPDTLAAVLRPIERGDETVVLLVDDEPDAVCLLERMLAVAPRAYRTLKAYSGQQALTIMNGTVPDVVLIDMVMPGLDGEETIRRMRADERLRRVPVVIVSAKDAIEGEITVGSPICIQLREGLGMAKWARCLGSLLSVLSAKYLPPPELHGSSGAGLAG